MRDFLHFFSVPAVLLTGCLFLGGCSADDVDLAFEIIDLLADVAVPDVEPSDAAKRACFSIVDATERATCEARYDVAFPPDTTP